MGKHRRRHHKHNNNHNKNQQCNNGHCKGDCQKQEDQAEIVTIETNEQLQELLDLIMEHGANRTERYQQKQQELNNALLEDAGIPIPPEEPQVDVAGITVVSDDSAI